MPRPEKMGALKLACLASMARDKAIEAGEEVEDSILLDLPASFTQAKHSARLEALATYREFQAEIVTTHSNCRLAQINEMTESQKKAVELAGEHRKTDFAQVIDMELHAKEQELDHWLATELHRLNVEIQEQRMTLAGCSSQMKIDWHGEMHELEQITMAKKHATTSDNLERTMCENALAAQEGYSQSVFARFLEPEQAPQTASSKPASERQSEAPEAAASVKTKSSNPSKASCWAAGYPSNLVRESSQRWIRLSQVEDSNVLARVTDTAALHAVTSSSPLERQSC